MKFSEEYTDIWQVYNRGEFIVITTNGFVKKNGEAVMGAGIALQAKNRFPGIAFAIGQGIAYWGNVPLVNVKYRIFTLPTKKTWTENADLKLIEDGLEILTRMVTELQLEKIYLPKPGCGNGKLNWETQVKPLCEKLLDSRFVICIPQIIQSFGIRATT